MIKITLEEFIKRARKIHKNKFDYSKSIYIGKDDKIEIICPIHKSFWQRPNSHYKFGCRLCVHDLLKNNNFIEQSKIIHNNKYDYSKVEYINQYEKIIIICPIHNEFLQLPKTHVQGSGCKQCYYIKSRLKPDAFLNFIKYSNIIHDNKYDYSESNYLGMIHKIKIKCPIHNDFWQVARDHIVGHGCNKCYRNVSKSETVWLNYLHIPDDGCHRQVKILQNRKFLVDGFDPITNTCYEYNGSFFHGNPEIYDQNDYNKMTKCTFGELYQKTLEKEKLIKEAGYKLISIWDTNWKIIQNRISKLQLFL